MGPNGSGKSTLSHVLMGRGDYEVTAGSITIDGEELLGLASHERAAPPPRRIEQMTTERQLGVLAITHYARLLDELRADRVHVLMGGRIVASGGPELADKLEEVGYEGLAAELGIESLSVETPSGP